MAIDPLASYGMTADPNKPVVGQGLDMLFSPLFGADWRTSMFQQGGQQSGQSAGARSVTNAILGQPFGSQGGMGSAMGQMPQSRQMGMGLGPNQNSSLFHTDNRTHGGMGSGSHL